VYIQSVVLVEEKEDVSHGSSLRDGQAAQGTSSQQLQQGQTVETFRQPNLNSGKFTVNVIHF